MANSGWEHFEHRADIGIRGFGPTLEIAFEQAATALIAVISELDSIEPRDKVEITCQGSDIEILFVDWLNSLICEMATRNMLFSRFEVHIENDMLNATAWGEAVDVVKHTPAVEVKGATYTSLSVTQGDDGLWVGQCVVDV